MTDDETTVPEGENKPTQNTQPARGATPPAVPDAATQGSAEPANDIGKILEAVKLPERREFTASADAPKNPPPETEAQILEEHIVKASAAREGAGAKAVPQPQQKEAAAERSSSIVTPVRTLKDDLETVVHDQKISLVHAATLEEEKKHGQQHLVAQAPRQASHRTAVLVFAATVFVFLGAAAIFGVFFVMQEQQALPPATQSSILFAERTLAFPLDGQTAEALKNQLAQARTQQLGSLGSITRITPTLVSTSTNGQSQAAPATLSQFFSALGISPPQELMGAIGPDFFFGFHVVDTNAPLFVIPVTSYDRAFAGMLAWESTMDPDLSPVFSSVSMTVATSGVPVARTFQDAVLRNYDVRELTDDSGTVVLYYSFPTPNILVIAQSPYSFTEILSRLQADREL